MVSAWAPAYGRVSAGGWGAACGAGMTGGGGSCGAHGDCGAGCCGAATAGGAGIDGGGGSAPGCGRGPGTLASCTVGPDRAVFGGWGGAGWDAAGVPPRYRWAACTAGCSGPSTAGPTLATRE
ncbi:hypothetical protein AB0H57_30480 [Micromonospora sp. NPDC050686]|uniref:hypothetical protein n=1 Tax=Micromonospora sp. NPDC050686 TaxID=3154631 RepID=UPI0033E94F58